MVVIKFDLENDELLGLSNSSIPLEFTRITTDAA